MNRSCSIVLSVAAITVLGGLTSWTPAQAQTPPTTSSGPVVPVEVALAARRDVPVMVQNIGAVQALNSVLVRARIDGTLDKVTFTEGQDVKAGDQLAEIDPRPYAATYAQALAKRAFDTATLGNAQRDLNRYSSLSRNDFASRQQVDTQSASVAQSQATLQGDDASLAAAKLNLDFANIKSPIDGRVGLRMVDPGNQIHASDAAGIVTVNQVHPIAVLFTLPQDILPRLQTAMQSGHLPVQARASDDRTVLSHGTLLTIDNSVDQATGTIRLKAQFDNSDDRLWPGQFVNAHLLLGTLKSALTVPSMAVNRGPGGLYVYLVKPDSTVAMQPVDVEQDDGQVAVIARGLGEGAQVVTNGQSRLQVGIKVLAQQPKAAS